MLYTFFFRTSLEERMSKQDPENTLETIQSKGTYARMYNIDEMKEEGRLIDMETLKLVQGIVLGDQEDKRLTITNGSENQG